jgi:hypothetical protein
MIWYVFLVNLTISLLSLYILYLSIFLCVIYLFLFKKYYIYYRFCILNSLKLSYRRTRYETCTCTHVTQCMDVHFGFDILYAINFRVSFNQHLHFHAQLCFPLVKITCNMLIESHFFNQNNLRSLPFWFR